MLIILLCCHALFALLNGNYAFGVRYSFDFSSSEANLNEGKRILKWSPIMIKNFGGFKVADKNLSE